MVGKTALKGLSPGTVIGVDRSFYEHYGVLAGSCRVLHYTSPKSDIHGDMRIRETGLDLFLRGGSSIWTMSFPSLEEARQILLTRFDELDRLLPNTVTKVLFRTGREIAVQAILRDYRVRSPEETLKRARSRLGETRYNLATRNCEHFAFWCATGLAASQQVEGFLHGGASLAGSLLGGLGSNGTVPASLASGWKPIFEKSSPISVHGNSIGMEAGRVPADSRTTKGVTSGEDDPLNSFLKEMLKEGTSLLLDRLSDSPKNTKTTNSKGRENAGAPGSVRKTDSPRSMR